MLVLKTGREGKLHIFFITKIFTDTPPGVFFYVIMIISLGREGGWRRRQTTNVTLSHGQGRPHAISSSNTLRKRPWRESRKSKGKIMVFLLVILVTGNRKRRWGGPSAPPPREFSFGHDHVAPGRGVPEGKSLRVVCFCPQSCEVHNLQEHGGRWHGGGVTAPPPRHQDRGPRGVSAPGASSFCAFYPSFCWHTWDRTTASLPGARPLSRRRACMVTKEEKASDKQALFIHTFFSCVFKEFQVIK